MLQAETETQLILHQPDNVTPQLSADPTQAREFNVNVLTSNYLHFTLSETEVVSSYEELAKSCYIYICICIYIYIYIYIYVCVCVCVCVCE